MMGSLAGFDASRIPPVTTLETLEDYALMYAGMGLRVFPAHSIRSGACSCGYVGCKSSGKHPRTVTGLREATTDFDQITAWWSAWPDANIGIATGDGLFVVDLDDNESRGKFGSEAWDTLASRHPAIDTVESETGGGGRHMFFYAPGEIVKTCTNLLPAVDIRGDGGYVIAPPSSHLSGDYYAWEGSSDPLEGAQMANAPDWLLDMVRDKPKAANGQEYVFSGENTGLQHEPEQWVSEYKSALSVLPNTDRDDWVRTMASIHSHDSTEAGFQIAAEWSQSGDGADKWDEADARRVWQSFDNKPGQRNVESIFYAARERGWTKPKPPPVIEQAQAMATVDQATEIPKGLTPLSGIQFDPHDDYQIEDLFGAGDLVMLYGPSNVGKSFFALHMAMCIAYREEWFRRRVRGGPVIYWTGEGKRSFVNRILAYRNHYGISRDDFWLYDSTDFNLTTASGIAAMLHVCQYVEPVAFFVDTMARAAVGAEENSNSDMSTVVDNISKALEATRTSLLIIHHSGKDGDKGARGASAVNAAVDVSLSIKENNGRKFATSEKVRDYEKGHEFDFDMLKVVVGVNSEGKERSSLVVVERSPQFGIGLRKELDELLTTMEHICRDNGGEPVTQKQIKECLSVPPGTTEMAHDRNVRNWLKDLLDKGQIEKAGHGKYSPNRTGSIPKIDPENIIKNS